jgi:hypothetical protein
LKETWGPGWITCPACGELARTVGAAIELKKRIDEIWRQAEVDDRSHFSRHMQDDE